MIQFYFQKTVDLIIGISWPIVVLSIVLFYRNALKELIFRIKKGKGSFGSTSFEFEANTREDFKLIGQKIMNSTGISENDKKLIEEKLSGNIADEFISEALDNILRVTSIVIHKNVTYKEAFNEIAKEKNVHVSTVRDACTRRIGLNIAQFREYLDEPEEFKSFLIKQFPNSKDIIEKSF